MFTLIKVLSTVQRNSPIKAMNDQIFAPQHMSRSLSTPVLDTGVFPSNIWEKCLPELAQVPTCHCMFIKVCVTAGHHTTTTSHKPLLTAWDRHDPRHCCQWPKLWHEWRRFVRFQSEWHEMSSNWRLETISVSVHSSYQANENTNPWTLLFVSCLSLKCSRFQRTDPLQSTSAHKWQASYDYGPYGLCPWCRKHASKTLHTFHGDTLMWSEPRPPSAVSGPKKMTCSATRLFDFKSHRRRYAARPNKDVINRLVAPWQSSWPGILWAHMNSVTALCSVSSGAPKRGEDRLKMTLPGSHGSIRDDY